MLFPREDVSIDLRVPRDEFLARLRQEVSETIWSPPLTEGLAGTVTADELRIRKVRPLRRNSFAPVFVGRISDSGRTITGSFVVDPVVRGFLYVWLLIVGGMAFTFPFAGFSSEGRLIPLAVPPFMFLIGLAMPRLGWSMNEADRQYIRETLVRAAQASPASN